MEVSRWAEKLDQIILRRFGCRIGQKRKGFEAPGESTLPRAIKSVNIGDLGQAVTLWLSNQRSPKNIVDSIALEDFAQTFREAGIPTLASNQVMKYIWGKIIYNSALNPLGAILGVSYGKLAKNNLTEKLNSKNQRL